ncbi:MAG: hypothetical protein AUJ85_03410 [Elusimicrobia bacterium CG1_02_37_114]|nr:MAG: hypothetical protein AUJ85_03410 [Elusimicrobia bacterium CG1_02_37_114]
MKCALCGGELLKKQVTEEVIEGNEHVVLKVETDVCTNCHERYYASGVVDKLIDIKENLKAKKLKLRLVSSERVLEKLKTIHVVINQVKHLYLKYVTLPSKELEQILRVLGIPKLPKMLSDISQDTVPADKLGNFILKNVPGQGVWRQ